MKKILSIVLMAIMALSITACGSAPSESSEPAATVATANDVLSGMVKLNNTDVFLPCQMSELEASGLKVEKPDMDLKADSMTPVNLLNNKGEFSGVFVYFMNSDGGKVKDSTVYALAYNCEKAKDIPFEFANGITSESTFDEVADVIKGDGSYDVEVEDNYIKASISKDKAFPNMVEIQFKENGEMDSVIITQLSAAAK